MAHTQVDNQVPDSDNWDANKFRNTEVTEPAPVPDSDNWDRFGRTGSVTLAQTQNNKPRSLSDDGVGISGSNRSGNTSKTDNQFIAPSFLQSITATPNKLGKMATSTYSISIYLMNKEEYRSLVFSQKKEIPTNQLLIQSGGINTVSSQSRNKYFDLDFYIDNVKIQTEIGTQSGSRANNGLLMEFDITEPNGVSFLQRLRAAIQEHSADKSPALSELNASFLMVIRFYGYDTQGNLISGNNANVKSINSDSEALIEKWFPFQFTNITYKLSNNLVEYRCSATVPQVNVAFSQSRATIPFDFQLTGSDILSLLNGKAETLAPDSADAAPKPKQSAPNASSLSNNKTYTKGLCEALNEWQKQLVLNGDQEYADEYKIEIENVPGLIDATLSKPGNQIKSRSAQTPPSTAAAKINPYTDQYDKNSKNWSVTRGTQISQLIDLVIRNSSYITRQQNVIYDEVAKKYITQTAGDTFQWFRIRSKVIPIQFDNKRRDYSYKITYIISRYQVNDPRVPVFPRSRYRGAHKIYNYWFTGQNTEVIDFEIAVDYNFVQPLGSNMGKASGVDNGDNTQASSGRIFERRFFQNKPGAEGTGGTSDTTTAAATVAERLYTDADIQKANLTILGDPDWVQQGEVLYQDINLNAFLSDGSVNFDAGEVLYEIRFNPVTDYSLIDGLMHVNAKNTAYSQATGELNLPQESSVFSAARVNNQFNNGVFTQTIIGTIRHFNASMAAVTVADTVKGSKPTGAKLDPEVALLSRKYLGSNAPTTASLPMPIPKPGSNTISDDNPIKPAKKPPHNDFFRSSEIRPGTLLPLKRPAPSAASYLPLPNPESLTISKDTPAPGPSFDGKFDPTKINSRTLLPKKTS